MRNLYARFVLWLIRPALKLHNGLAAGKLELTVDAQEQRRFFESALGDRTASAVCRLVQAEIKRAPWRQSSQ